MNKKADNQHKCFIIQTPHDINYSHSQPERLLVS